jgi:uncharacterized membrane-anchored protein YhcB (DUF1043 family)
MTKKLEELFDLPRSEELVKNDATEHSEPADITPEQLEENRGIVVAAIDEIEHSLPTVTGLDQMNTDYDEIRQEAMEHFKNTADLAYNVDARFSGELLNAANQSLGLALEATKAKHLVSLKTIEAKMKKLKLDSDLAKKAVNADGEQADNAVGFVLSRNEILDRLVGNRDSENDKKE